MANKGDEKIFKVKCLQENLLSIRKIAGWTTEELGKKIGVTKQTISNLEKEKTPMSLTQYLAIRAILDEEIKNNKDNIVLPQVIDLLIEKNNELNDEERDEIKDVVTKVAATSAGGIKGIQLESVFSALLRALASPTGSSAIRSIASGIVGAIGSKNNKRPK